MKNKKLILKVIVILLPIFVIWLLLSIKKKNPPLSSLKPVDSSSFSSPSSNNVTVKNDVSTLSWDNYTNNFKDIALSGYNIELTSLEETSNSISKVLGFPESSKKILSSGSIVWNSLSQNILFVKSDNLINIQFITPQTTKSGFLSVELTNTINNFISKILPGKNIQIVSIEYFKEDKNIPIIGTKENSKLAKVNLSQSIDGIRLLPDKLSGDYTISVTIDSSLKVHTVKIRDLINNYLPTNKKTEILSSSLKQIVPNSVHRLTPFSIVTEELLKTNPDNTFYINNVEAVYLINKNQLRPVFYLSGKLNSKTTEIGSASFVTPIPGSE